VFQAMPVDNAEPSRLAAEEYVFGDGHFLDEREFLKDHPDAGGGGVSDIVKAAGTAAEKNVAGETAVRIDAGEYLHQGRFTGSVLAYEGVDLAFFEHERDTVERPDAGKLLDDVAHFEKGHILGRATRHGNFTGRAGDSKAGGGRGFYYAAGHSILVDMPDRAEIESILSESRVFPPPAEFAANAHIKSFEEYEELYKRAEADPEGFWAEQAEELYWFKKWDTVLEWNEPFAKWFVGGRSTSLTTASIVTLPLGGRTKLH
jgi:hypothetical protein